MITNTQFKQTKAASRELALLTDERRNEILTAVAEAMILNHDRILKANAEDLLNYGYCLWFSGNVKDASDCFHSYLKETGEKKEVILDIERELIKEKEITPTEQQMMLYIL